MWCNDLHGSEALTEARKLHQPGTVERCEAAGILSLGSLIPKPLQRSPVPPPRGTCWVW